MSMPKAQIRGYVRDWKGDAAEKQEARLLAVDCDQIYVEGRDGETVDVCINSLLKGDTLAVALASRLHTTRDGLRAGIDRVLGKGVTIWEVYTDRRLTPGDENVSEIIFDALNDFTSRRHTWDKEGARKAALARWDKTSAAHARKVWADFAAYPRAEDALAHPDMAGWTKAQAYRQFGKRGSVPWSRDTDPMTAHVYFIRDGGTRRVKIGVSTNVANRVRDLSHGLLSDLKILATMPGGYQAERDLHARFADFRIGGEWFKLEGDLATFVKSLPPYEPPAK